jgi:hypothetical protein
MQWKLFWLKGNGKSFFFLSFSFLKVSVTVIEAHPEPLRKAILILLLSESKSFEAFIFIIAL